MRDGPAPAPLAAKRRGGPGHLAGGFRAEGAAPLAAFTPIAGGGRCVREDHARGSTISTSSSSPSVRAAADPPMRPHRLETIANPSPEPSPERAPSAR